MSRPARYGAPQSSPERGAFVFPVNTVFHQIVTSFALVYHF
jgi:hypothetical protein